MFKAAFTCGSGDDYKFSEVIRQKPLIATLAPNLIRHPYIALERQCTYKWSDIE